MKPDITDKDRTEEANYAEHTFAESAEHTFASIHSHTFGTRAESATKSRRSSQVAKRVMESYGTIPMDSVHGRLFELSVYMDNLYFHVLVYFGAVLFGAALWPIAALMAIPLGIVAGDDKILQRAKHLLILASIIGTMLFLVPILLIGVEGGFEKLYSTSLRDRVISEEAVNIRWILSSDLLELFLATCLILLIVVFSFAHHDITNDVENYKMSTALSWHRRHDEHGQSISIPPLQAERLMDIVGEDRDHRPTPESARRLRTEGSILLKDMVRVLHTLPGWECEVESLDQHVRDSSFDGQGFFHALDKLADEASGNHLWPIDIWLVQTQWYGQTGDTPSGSWQGIRNLCFRTALMMQVVFGYVVNYRLRLLLLGLLSFVRALLPRIWFRFIDNINILPSEPWKPEGLMVLYSILITFLVSMCWMSLFFFVLMEYRRNMAQLIAVSALADPRKRATYSQLYLMSCFWFHLDWQETKEVLAKMPLLDFKVSTNVVGFWRLREYVSLDRADNRMAISILIQIVVIWIVTKFLVTLATMYLTHTLPPSLITTLFDLVVIGGMVLLSLRLALMMNLELEEHRRIYAEARYTVIEEIAEKSYDNSQSGSADPNNESLQNLLGVRKLLEEYLEMIKEFDPREEILFGIAMTPTKLLSSCATLFFMIYTMIMRMIVSGQLRAPTEIKERMIQDQAMNQTAFLAMSQAAHFLSKSAAMIIHGKGHSA